MRRTVFTLCAWRMLLGLLFCRLWFLPAQAAELNQDRQIAFEALSRLKGIDLEANPSIKSVLLKLLDEIEGTPDYVVLVRDFRLPGHERQLLAVAIRHPGTDAAADALRLLLERNALPLLTETLAGTNAAPLLQTLAASTDRRLAGLMESLIADPSRDPALRRQAVRALGNSRQGRMALLALAREGRLPEDLKFTARSTLLDGRGGPRGQDEINRLLPPLKGLNEQSFPPMAVLLNGTGSAVRGAEVFRRETTACIQCHQVNGDGIEFGPNLSEIGTKLGKDALYESVLDPSAGISFGYEGWQIELKNGDELSGMIVSETGNEIGVKVRGGTVIRAAKENIAGRRKLTLSIMPAGVQQSLSTQDLVDLVEYLSSLKKATQ